MKKPIDEEAHFRIDEHERRLADVDKAVRSIPDHVNGGVAALEASQNARHAATDEKFQHLLAKHDELLTAHKETLQAHRELLQKLDAHTQALQAPTTRESTIHLPSGPVHMTVREKKDH